MNEPLKRVPLCQQSVFDGTFAEFVEFKSKSPNVVIDHIQYYGKDGDDKLIALYSSI